MNKNKKSFAYVYGVYGGVGIQLASAVGIMAWLGYYVDKKLGTMPWFLLIGVCLGTAGGFYNLYRLLKREKDDSSGDS